MTKRNISVANAAAAEQIAAMALASKFEASWLGSYNVLLSMVAFAILSGGCRFCRSWSNGGLTVFLTVGAFFCLKG